MKPFQPCMERVLCVSACTQMNKMTAAHVTHIEVLVMTSQQGPAARSEVAGAAMA